MFNRFLIIISILILAGVLSGCAVNGPEREVDDPVVLSSTSIATSTNPSTRTPTSTATETLTPVTPTETYTPEPSETPTATPTLTQTSTITPTAAASSGARLSWVVAQNPVRIYMIAPDDSGSLCNGIAVGVKTAVEKTDNLVKDVEAALNLLIHTKSQYIGNLYNPLSHSDIQSVRVSDENGRLIIQFRGTYNRVDDPSCNNNLVRAQVWSTIKQFGGIKNNDMTVYMNNKLLGDILAGK